LTKSTEFDLVCSIDGAELDFRSEFGRYFVCECKDLKNRANVTAILKFCSVLDSVGSRFGIFISKFGIAAEDEIRKLYQRRGIVVVVLELADLESVARGENFINLLRHKYEKVRLDLRKRTEAKRTRLKASAKPKHTSKPTP